MREAIITTMPEKYRPKPHWKKILLVGLVLAVVAAAAFIKLGMKEAPPASAARTYVQSATGWAKIDNFVSAEFPKDPTPGNLLVAVVSNSHAAEIETPPGWFLAINETKFTPGQAIFYKIAAQNENRVVTVSRVSQRVNLGLQIFEYPGIDPASPIDLVASSGGEGLVVHSGTVGTTGEKSLLVAASTVSRRQTFNGLWNNGFDLRNVGQTKGDGLISFAMADLVVNQSGNYSTALALDRPIKWRSQIVAFHRLDQNLRQAAEDEQADVAIELSVSHENPEPGEAITYTATARNSGAKDLNNLFVQVPLPRGVSLREAGISQGRYAPGVGMWEVGDLPQGHTATLNLHVYVDERTYNTSIITRASLYIMEQMDYQEENNEDYAAIDIQKVVGTKRECPEIKNIVFEVAEGAATVDTRNITVKANAAGANYLLLSENPNRAAAVYYSLSNNVQYELSPKPGEKTLYAWFMSFCSSSFIQKHVFKYVPASVAPAVIESPEAIDEENTAAADDIVLPETASEDTATGDAAQPANESASSTASEEESGSSCGLTYRFSYSMVPEDANHEVRLLQKLLQCLGYFPASQATTAIFGPITEQAVKDFQATHGIEPVGYVGPATIESLNQYTQ